MPSSDDEDDESFLSLCGGCCLSSSDESLRDLFNGGRFCASLCCREGLRSLDDTDLSLDSFFCNGERDLCDLAFESLPFGERFLGGVSCLLPLPRVSDATLCLGLRFEASISGSGLDFDSFSNPR